MRPCPTPRLLMSSLALALAAGHAQAQLQILPQNVYSISADGSRAVMGQLGAASGSTVSLIDVASGVITDIGGNAGSAGRPMISADGSTVLATMPVAGATRPSSAVYDIGAGTWTLVPRPAGATSATFLASWAISADGRYVGGSRSASDSSVTSAGYVADTQSGAFTLLDGGTAQGRIVGISSDASRLYGQANSSTTGSQWSLNPDGSYARSDLKKPDAPTANLFAASALSANDQWVAGNSFNSALPYRLNTGTGEIQYFAKLPFASGTGRSVASIGGISNDGRIITGIHTPTGSSLGGSFAFVWKAADTDTSGDNLADGTVMTLDEHLAGYGIDLENHYNFLSVLAMSADGRVISGIALDNISKDPVGFLVSVPVPEPSSYAMLGAGLGLLGWVARRRRGKAEQQQRQA